VIVLSICIPTVIAAGIVGLVLGLRARRQLRAARLGGLL
jgi:type III secretory pathway component EscS